MSWLLCSTIMTAIWKEKFYNITMFLTTFCLRHNMNRCVSSKFRLVSFAFDLTWLNMLIRLFKLILPSRNKCSSQREFIYTRKLELHLHQSLMTPKSRLPKHFYNLYFFEECNLQFYPLCFVAASICKITYNRFTLGLS